MSVLKFLLFGYKNGSKKNETIAGNQIVFTRRMGGNEFKATIKLTESERKLILNQAIYFSDHCVAKDNEAEMR